MKLAPLQQSIYTSAMLTYHITETDHCRQAGSFVRNLLPTASLSYLRKLLKSEHVAVNGAPTVSGEKLLCLGDTLTLKESSKTRVLVTKRKPQLDILHEDHWVTVFNKAPGLPMHRAAEVNEWNLVELGTKFLAERDAFQGKLRPVNRLDRGTSGAVILASSPSAAAMFGKLVKEVGLGKVYLAVVQGRVPEKGMITMPLEGKEAETAFLSLFQGEKVALVAAYPLTGRMHQIRQHFQSIGHPIVGDVRYGGRSLAGYQGILLHSFRTALRHPATGEILTIFAPLPGGFLSVLRGVAEDAFPSLLRSFPGVPVDPPEIP